MLWVYDHYKYFNSFSAGAVVIRQNLTSRDGPRTEKVNIDTRAQSVLHVTIFTPSNACVFASYLFLTDD